MLVLRTSTTIAVALPRLADALDTSLGSVSWLVTSYLIAMASLQPVAGSSETAWGAGRSCSVGSPGCRRIGGRRHGTHPLRYSSLHVLQALAGALIVPNGVALLREAVPSGRLGSRLGLVNRPLLVVPLVLGWRWIPARRRASGSASFDLSGAALLCVSLVALAWLLNGRVSARPPR